MSVSRIMNSSDFFVDESIEGIILAYPTRLKTSKEDNRAVIRADAPVKDKVAIVTGGGYGHLPVFLGYVGEGLADGVAVGNIFTSPSSDTIVNVTRSVNGGKGILYLYGNYTGDGMNFDLAAELVELEGIVTETVRISDDVASAPRSQWKQRRGVAGLFFAYKMAGAAAEKGMDLNDVKRIAEKTASKTVTMGIAMSSCWIPGSARPIFEIGNNEIEIGMGIHGEPGVKRSKMTSSADIADDIVNRLLHDLDINANARVAVLVNGLGSTTFEELYILYKDVHNILIKNHITIVRSFVGEYATSLEMAGASITLIELDDELVSLLNEPASSPFVSI